MKLPRKRWITIATIVLIGGGALLFGSVTLHRASTTITVSTVPLYAKSAKLVKEGDTLLYRVDQPDGKTETMTPDQFARAIYDTHQARGFWASAMSVVLNVSSARTAGWVLLGLVGQVLFAGRMIVQWLASEKEKRSVVPVAFWWMALSGATLLLIYFGWRKDIVGILGQSTGWLIYTRNLYFIYFPKQYDTDDTPDGATEVADATTNDSAAAPGS